MNKIILKISLVLLAVATLGLTSCGDPKEDEHKNKFEVVADNFKGDIPSGDDIVLDANTTYFLSGTLRVKDGAKLTIPAGTVIKGKNIQGTNAAFYNYIIVEQGGKIFVNGTAEKPVVMTAELEQPGAWGGLIVNGRAPISGPNISDNVGTTEVDTDLLYGGNDVNDNSGVIKYLKLLYTGANLDGDTEHNGLTLNGVGAGTIIENIYIEGGMDDAIEFFGGSVNVTNLLAVDPDDDMFDFTQGYTGTLKNCYGIWTADYLSTEEDPRGVEADGNLDGVGTDHYNQSNFKIVDMTIDIRSTGADVYMHDAIKVRRGATATITNALVKGTGIVKDLIDLKDKKGNATADTKINVTNSLVNPVTGKEINIEGENSNIIIEAGNTGANTSVFSWTGFRF
ncbi:MAG: hypothetical protein PHP31_08530 [Lentimicrobiaceae bacterium]|nr:hypothetical protein [Lentimicrobiaceae bacterium]